MTFQEIALRIGLALAIGFMIGLERGWQDRWDEEGQRTAGLRTFTLIGLLGGVVGALSIGQGLILIGAALVTLGLGLAAFMWREGQRDKDFSATSLVAALLTFVLGAYAVEGESAIAAGAGVAAAILLATKATLHGWLERVTWIELRAGLLLAAMTFIALPLLPDRALDPWGAINLHDLWLMTILIAAVSFAGYAAAKIAGAGRGLLLAAGLGGLFASTAVTLSLARLARGNDAHVRLLAGGILAAGAIMVLRVLIVSGLLNPGLALDLAPALLAGAAVLGLSAFLLARSRAGGEGRSAPEFDLRNPFDLTEVLRFALLLAVVLVAVALARQYLGEPGVLGLAVLAGLADVDALTISMATQPGSGALARQVILAAVAVNSLAKCAYAAYAGGARIGGLALVPTLVAVAAAGAAYLSMSAT